MVIGDRGVYEVICFVVLVRGTKMVLLQASGSDDYHTNGGLCYKHGAATSFFSSHKR